MQTRHLSSFTAMAMAAMFGAPAAARATSWVDELPRRRPKPVKYGGGGSKLARKAAKGQLGIARIR